MRLVLLGDGESPHLLKWARALAPQVELWAASSRGFLVAWDGLVPPERRLALATQPNFAGGNVALLRELPHLARWLRSVRADWVHAHYLSSHGTLAWLAMRWLGAPGRLVGSAWGSDILVTPQRSRLMRWVTSRVLRACALSTSDSQVMAQQMHALGALEVMVFPFGLEALPPLPAPGSKRDHLFFANRGLESIYAPAQVLRQFAGVAAGWLDAELVVANDGALRPLLEKLAADLGIARQVRFAGRLDAATQVRCYAQARWYLSLPESDSVSVSVLEAMAHGCIPILSDLPANRELVRSGDNGLVVAAAQTLQATDLAALLPHAEAMAQANHGWVATHALFAPAVSRFLARLRALDDAAAAGPSGSS